MGEENNHFNIGEDKLNKPTENIYKFKWFMSLTRRKTSQSMNDSKENVENFMETDKISSNNNSVFYTLRKRIQKKFTSSKVKAFETDVPTSSTNLGCSDDVENRNRLSSSSYNNNDFARIVIERHHQNPIRFSSPNSNSPVITNNEVVESVLQNSNLAENNLDTIMELMRVDLLKYGWYWGKLTRSAAQKRLGAQSNGSFLVRDSQTEKYQFTLSFRSSGMTLHCRIDYKENYWSFSGLSTPTQYETMIDLIEETIKKSESGVIGYVKQNSVLQPPFPVRLIKPINRFYEVTSLQHLCRFIIKQKVNSDNITSLPLPIKLKNYVEENYYDL